MGEFGDVAGGRGMWRGERRVRRLMMCMPDVLGPEVAILPWINLKEFGVELYEECGSGKDIHKPYLSNFIIAKLTI